MVQLGSRLELWELATWVQIPVLSLIFEGEIGMITSEDFGKVEMRVGKIVGVDMNENARYTTHILMIDFGKGIGVKKSGARLQSYPEPDPAV